MVAATRGSRGSRVRSMVCGELRRSRAKTGEVENVSSGTDEETQLLIVLQIFSAVEKCHLAWFLREIQGESQGIVSCF